MAKNKNKTQETGRSMVEMLGVLAVIGVLSITGITGYTTAMNKHKANQILDAASKRAVAVSTQIQRGSTSPTLGEFDDNEVGGAKFNTTVEKVGSSQFKLTFATAPSDDVKTQIKSMTGDGTGTVLVDDNVSRFLYNNDLSAGVSNTNNRDTSDATKCATGYKGTDCDTCDTGYEPDGNGGCKSSGTPYRRGILKGYHWREGSTSLYSAVNTPKDDSVVCPEGYSWVTYATASALTKAEILSIFSDSTVCSDCSANANLWLKDCPNSSKNGTADCTASGTAWLVYYAGNVGSGRARDSNYFDALCVR